MCALPAVLPYCESIFICAEPERGEILWETVDVIIPAYRPGKEFEKLLDSLSTQNYPVGKNSCYEYRREILEHGLGEKISKSERGTFKKRRILTTVEPDAGEQDCLIQILWYL